MRLASLGAFAGLVFAALLASPAIGETIESVTTPFDADKCVHKPGSEPEDDGEWRCIGHDRIPILMTAGDARVYISYGAKAAHELAARQTLGHPNGEGTSIEWRIVRGQGGRGRVFATIMRWTTAVPVDDPKVENGTYRGEVLVVTRLGPGGVCTSAMSTASRRPMRSSWRARSPTATRARSAVARTSRSCSAPRARASAASLAGSISRTRNARRTRAPSRRLSSRRRRPCRGSCRRTFPTIAPPACRRGPGRTRPRARCPTAPTLPGSACRSA